MAKILHLVGVQVFIAWSPLLALLAIVKADILEAGWNHKFTREWFTYMFAFNLLHLQHIIYHIPTYYIILLHVSCLNTITFFQWTPPTDILSDIFKLWRSIWHSVWQSFFHSIWHSTWHSIWRSIGYSFIFFLAFFLAFYLTYILTFYSAFFLSYVLTFYLAFFLASYFACIFDSLFGILFGSPSGMLSDILSGMCSGPRPAPLHPELAIEFGPVRAQTALRLAMSFWHLL